LSRCDDEYDAFLRLIVTGDEMRIHHYDPERKCQSVKWEHLTSPVRRKFKSQSIAESGVHTFLAFSRTSHWALSGMGCDDTQWDAAAEDGDSE